MKREYKRNPILLALIDPTKRSKFKSICNHLRLAGETQDFINLKASGEPSKRSFLSLLDYGLSGINFETISGWIEATE